MAWNQVIFRMALPTKTGLTYWFLLGKATDDAPCWEVWGNELQRSRHLVAIPALWNGLPQHIRLALTLAAFPKQLKTKLFGEYLGLDPLHIYWFGCFELFDFCLMCFLFLDFSNSDILMFVLLTLLKSLV